MFTEIGQRDRAEIVSMMLARASATLRGVFERRALRSDQHLFYVFPDDWTSDIGVPTTTLTRIC